MSFADLSVLAHSQYIVHEHDEIVNLANLWLLSASLAMARAASVRPMITSSGLLLFNLQALGLARLDARFATIV